MKPVIFVWAIFLPFVSIAQNCSIYPPVNLYADGVTSCGVVLHWTSPVEPSTFQVRYKICTQTTWSAPMNAGTDTSFNFGGLASYTAYYVSVRSICPNGSKSQWATKKVTTSNCPAVTNVTLNFISAASVNIGVTAECNPKKYYYRYKKPGGSWISYSTKHADSLIINNLIPDSTYVYEVSVCKTGSTNWSSPDTFVVPKVQLPQPNIVFIILDDAMYDVFSCNGAPSWFQTPNIDRIAHEGVNFKNTFAITSLCIPSRAAMATGLYPTRTDVYDNSDSLKISYEVLSERLMDAGYYTAMIGKNHRTFGLGPNGEFNYYMIANTVADKYGTHPFDLNGTVVNLTGCNSIIMADTAAALIKRTNQPLFLWWALRVPHVPMVPMESFDGRYDDQVISFNPDTARFTKNYPSFFYDQAPDFYLTGANMVDAWYTMYEVLAGADSAIGHLLKAIDSSGKAENTMVIFTSDNGFLLGTYEFNYKEFAYERSIRLPLFVRYSPWFAPNTKVTDNLTLNIDITSTIMEAAGIPDTVPVDGISLHKLYNRQSFRNDFYYLMKHHVGNNLPTWRAVRDSNYKFITYTCSDTVEELFDVHNDPLELNNLINASGYESNIEYYRERLKELKTFYSDTLPDATPDCYLANPVYSKTSVEQESEVIPATFSDMNELLTSDNSDAYVLQIFTMMGQRIFVGSAPEQTNILKALPSGYYLLSIYNSKESTTQLLIVQQ